MTAASDRIEETAAIRYMYMEHKLYKCTVYMSVHTCTCIREDMKGVQVCTLKV